jgi:hypothetical protein
VGGGLWLTAPATTRPVSALRALRASSQSRGTLAQWTSRSRTGAGSRHDRLGRAKQASSDPRPTRSELVPGDSVADDLDRYCLPEEARAGSSDSSRAERPTRPGAQHVYPLFLRSGDRRERGRRFQGARLHRPLEKADRQGVAIAFHEAPPPQRAAPAARQSQDHSPPDQAPPFEESRSVCRRESCPCCRARACR